MMTVLFGQAVLNNRRARAPMKLYRSARSKGWRRKVWSVLTRRSRRLHDLSALEATYTIRASHYLGTKTVSISQIRGSEGRSDDFDIDFCPLQSHTEERWLNIAAARLQGVQLPAIELVQVEDSYFVRDGHHRISVARALGQEYIEASVTIWEMSGPLPEESPLATPALGYASA